MVDFRRMPPMDRERRKLKAMAVTALVNGARFEFISFTQAGHIRGRYLDYVGEWCHGYWSDTGRFGVDFAFPNADLDLNWNTSR